MKKKERLHPNSYERITPKMKKFIENSVIKLGSLKAVERHYSNPYNNTFDLVSRYARKVARELGYVTQG